MSSNSTDSVKFVVDNNPINPNTFDLPGTSTPVFIVVASIAASVVFLCLCSLIACACHKKNRTPTLQTHVTLQKSMSRKPPAPAPIPDRHIKSSLAEDINSTGYPLSPKTSAKTFKVYFAHNKSRNDELNLVKGDSVVVNLVYQDGWCRGVSKRAGGPAFFPGNILGPEAASLIFNIFTKKQKQFDTSAVIAGMELPQQGYNSNMPGNMARQSVINIAPDAQQIVYSHQPHIQSFNPHESVQAVQPPQQQVIYGQQVQPILPLQEESRRY